MLEWTKYLTLACGVGAALLGAGLASDWRGCAKWFREYTFIHTNRGPAFLRGTYDAPVIAYRLIGGFLAFLGLLLVLGALIRSK
jgi:hypothetical protein